MNEFDPELQFTLEEANPTLTFLDTEIYVSESGILEHKFFRKEMASSVLTNFELGVIPRKYLISTLTGEIYRSLRTQFSENGYPRTLIEEKIREIPSRNFAPKPKNVENIDYSSQYTIVLPFTSPRCENISLNIVRAIKAITPNYKINFAWRLLKLGEAVTPRLKPHEPLSNCIN